MPSVDGGVADDAADAEETEGSSESETTSGDAVPEGANLTDLLLEEVGAGRGRAGVFVLRLGAGGGAAAVGSGLAFPETGSYAPVQVH